MSGTNVDRSAIGWNAAFWVLLVCWTVGAALTMANVRGGFLTSYLADLTFPPFFYIVLRGKLSERPMVVRPAQWFGRTPSRAAVSIFLVGASAELSSLFWPRGPFGGTFDPWDIAAYAFGLAICVAAELRQTDESAKSK